MSLASVIQRSRREKEDWRYTDIEALLKRPVMPLAVAALPAEPQPVSLTIRDGVLQLGGMATDIIKQTDDVISIYAESCHITQPLELVFVTTEAAKDKPVRLYILLEESARLNLIERHEGVKAQIVETKITLKKQAKLVHGKIVRAAAPHIATTQVDIAEGAYYDNFALIKDTPLTRNEIDARLNGKLAQCALNGVMLLKGQDHADTWTRITHAAPHGTSRQLYKSVVKDKARGVFQGKILVAEGAQKTDGRQMSRALLLSDQAEMDAKPELEIYADDVKCAHGCTAGDLDADALFYLRARGLSEDQARALLLRAFIDEVIDEMHVDQWRDVVRVEAGRWFDGQD